MSILNKPYEISVWDDVWNSEKGQFEEKRLGIIGKHTMASFNRAMEPLFTRNVNGVKKLTFKMYKRYKDPVTGEQVENPFVDWLVSERKVKLYYEDKWHDFIVKNIVENSNNYLYTYQLEDALVQELSKNGFGIVLDTQLMNNMGTANELASKVLAETDWTVSDESEAFVQTIEDQLVYAVTTSSISAYHVIDQTDRRRGVDVRLATIPAGKQVLVFYSSCVNKPYRFQFIYLDGKEIQKDSHRIILNKDCQYYIDVGAESNYTLKDSSADLYLPAGFNISSQTEDGVAGVKISGAYRGKRYGFTQQSKYVPTLDKYVSIYEKMGSNLSVNDAMGGDVDYEKTGSVHQSVMNDPWAGIFINGSTLGLQSGKTYELTYKFRIISGQVETIGGHGTDFITKDFQVYGGDLLNTLGGQSYEYSSSIPYPDNGKFTIGTEYTVKGRFTLKDTFIDKKIWIQPNRGYATNSSAPITFQVFDVTLKEVKEYYGYLHAEYTSPALTQNIVSNTTFQSTSGWTGTRVNSSESARAEVETVLGYFSGSTFVNSIDELASKSFDPVKKTYTPYLKITFNSADSRVINSGPYDNRVLLANIEAKDKWAMSYTCKSATGGDVTNLGVTLGEYTYDTGTLCHELSTSKITFSSFTTPSGSTHAISEVTNSTYSKEQFKKNSQVRICIAPPSGVTYPYTCYIENMELFKAIYNGSTLITPNEQGEDIEDRVIDKTYYYFTPDAAKDIENEEQLVVETKTKTLGYDTYIPVFNTDAQKIRSVTAKESNYFNILQSISETFEAWLVLDVERNDSANPGRITAKKVAFKNYVGDNNYAGFRYGVNLKDIQRTYESKNIVTKLIVKQNSNEHAENGFCTIARAGANPTGENYIYDFQYFHNRGLLNARDFLEEIYITSGAVGPDLGNGAEYNLRGYYSRIKNLNKKIQDENDVLINIAKDITQYKADLEIAESGYEAAVSGIQEVQDSFKKLTNQDIDNITDDSINSRTDVRKLLKEYSTYVINEQNYSADKTTINSNLEAAKARYDTKKAVVQTYLDQKAALNQKFFSQYSRFIQEGTWMSEEYVDDEKYYADALSVMYNSCYPQVAYSINVLELSKLPGYELFTFGLGDKTFAEDPEFFGDNLREEVIVTELSERLDDPSKNQIKVQNFKNQFQDLFQKITATVQQAQYNTGSYEKAVALAEAGQERKQQFLTEALDSASARLAAAGQQSVTWGNDGITVKSVNSPCDAIRMVGGAILLSKQDENGKQKWVTGVTSDGVSASLITAGVINAGEISIMNYDEPVFRWDSYGISAYDSNWYDSEIGTVVSGVNSRKFVRFDKHGLYGINNAGIDGASWHPANLDDIDDKATFALTWDGLKVTGANGGTALLGKQERNGKSYIMTVSNSKDGDTFRISEDGRVEVAKSLKIGIDEDVTIEDYVGNAVDSIQVGGKNLLRKDKYINRKTISQNSVSGYGFTHDATTEIVEFGGIKIPFLDANTEYIISFTTWIDTDDEKVKQPFNCDIQEIPEEIFTATKYPTRLTWRINSSNIESSYNDYYYLRFFSNQLMENYYVRYPIYITDIQLERGNKATDWTPAPEDVSADIAATDTLLTTLTNEISSGEGVFSEGLNQDITKTALNNFGLQAGSLVVYDKDSYNEETGKYQIIFSAQATKDSSGNPTNGAITLAGWTVTSNQLSYHDDGKELGQEGTFGIYPKGLTSGLHRDFAGTLVSSEDAWVMTAGNTFGLTKNGEVYATAGKIGNMTIGDLNSRVENIIGKNLAIGTKESASWSACSYFVDGVAQKNASSNAAYMYYSAAKQNLKLQKGVTYTLSFDVKADSNFSSYNLRIMPYDTSSSSTCKIENQTGVTSEFSRKSWSFTIPDSAPQEQWYRIRIDNNGSTNGSAAALYITNLKVEKGSSATDWCPADEDGNAMQADVSNDFSWKFSPTDGLFMWNGDQTTDALFSITDKGLVMNGTGEFNGTLISDYGVLGPFELNSNGLFSDYVEITKEHVKFPIQGSLVLGDNNVKLETTNTEERIITNGLHAFTISNYGGAGIKFLQDEQEQQITRNVDIRFHIFDPTLSGDPSFSPQPAYMVYFGRFEFQADEPLLEEFSTEIGLISDYGMRVGFIGIGSKSSYNRITVTVTVPAGSTSGICKTTLKTVNVASAADGWGLSLDENYVYYATTSLPSTQCSVERGDTKYTWGTEGHFDSGYFKWFSDIKATDFNGNNNILYSLGSFCPDEGKSTLTLGDDNHKWADISLLSGSKIGSDRRLKNSILPLSDEYNNFFDLLLTKKFKYNEGTSNRDHIGFIAQDVEEALKNADLTLEQFAGICIGKNDEQTRFIRYDEFVALNTWQIQKLKPRVSTLEQTIIEYESRISKLESEIENLKSV